MAKEQAKYLAAIIGAGPAGLFAARELAIQGVHVVLINRDIKPGGLAEYGIYPTKLRMKDGLRAQFRQILATEGIGYFGNLTIGEQADLTLADLRALGFQAILVTAGAQATKWLGLPGEDLDGVYHAKDLVYHYNRLPPFSLRRFAIGRRVAVIGAGNVMLDIAHYLSGLPQVEEILTVVRRGPAEVKFTRVELEYIANLIDQDDLHHELERVAPLMAPLGQDAGQFQALIDQALERAAPIDSRTRFRLRFLVSPTRILGDETGRVQGLEVEENTLVAENGEVKARGLGSRRVLPVDTVIFAIGDRVDEALGLPAAGTEFVKTSAPRFPVEGLSYETPLEGVFVAGWSRKASYGLVGVARKDGINGARVVLQYLQTLTPMDQMPLDLIRQRLCQARCPLITQAELALLDAAEHQRAAQLGVDEFKFKSNQEMLESLGLLPAAFSLSELPRR